VSILDPVRKDPVTVNHPSLLRRLGGLGAALSLGFLTACSSGGNAGPSAGSSPSSSASTSSSVSASASPSATTTNIYEHTAAGMIADEAKAAKPLVYVPNTIANTVQVIDPRTYKVIDRFATGKDPNHVVPSWDLKTLWVNDTLGNDLIPIDPRTGKSGKKVPVVDPYNLYFTPDGSHALVMAERFHRIDILDPHTMKLQRSLPVPCNGVNHADFSADLSFFVASCEFSGKLLVVDKDATKVRSVIDLNAIKTKGATPPHEAMHSHLPQAGLMPGASAMPQDVRLTPNGKFFLAADMLRNGVWVIDAQTQKFAAFIQTGKGTHGIYPSRDGTRIFVSNRDEGSVTVLNATTLKIMAKWTIPGGGSPDMGGVSADGKELWLSGRYHAEVCVFDTATGKVTHRIKVDAGPHGLAVWPQPGRFSLGHTGNMR
jgi:YVTN family beta-propeller protein